MADYMQQRTNMIEGQLKPCKILDERLLNAVSRIKREDFVPDPLKEVAYMDDDIIIDSIHYMLRPASLMTMIQALNVTASDKVLDIGCTFGYSTLVLSYLAERVVGVEEVERFVKKARSLVESQGSENTKFVQGTYKTGYQEESPFDVILVQRAWEKNPESLLDQLAPGGRLAYIRQSEPFYGRAILLTKSNDHVSESVIDEIYAPYNHSAETEFRF